MGFPGGSDSKESACGRPGFDPWVGKFPWRRKWQPTPVFLPGESQGQRSLAGYCPWSRKEWGPTERLHFHFSLSQLCPSFPILMAGVKFCTLLQYSHRSSYLDQTLLQILTLFLLGIWKLATFTKRFSWRFAFYIWCIELALRIT